MKMIEAFKETLELAVKLGMPEVKDLQPELDYQHLVDMYIRITEAIEGFSDEDKFSEAKLGRWLGWAQAALVASGVGVTLEDVKAINMKYMED